ncbi:hypothetical protein QZH41_012413 [Actinostola sp. cb2023]|nr:hypothetical protein QZH41_012413 [Actinostola sp. cb2023]
MASCCSSVDIFSLSPELLTLILSYLPAKSVLNVSETCRRLKELAFDCDVLWKRLCKLHLSIDLQVKGPFPSYFDIYQLLYKFNVIVKHHIYGQYVPEYIYHWGALILYDYNRHHRINYMYRVSRLFTKSRFMKTWDLTNSDLIKVRPGAVCSFVTSDGIDALKMKLGINRVQDFQKLVLQRCIRNQKKMSQQFISASILKRSRTFKRHMRDNPDVKSILLTKELLTVLLDDFDDIGMLSEADLEMMPQQVGMDFIKGHFHKTGFEQVKSYVLFVQTLQDKCNSRPHLSKLIPVIATTVYEKLRGITKQRHITYIEYLDHADICCQRADEVHNWHCDISEDAKFEFRTHGIEEHKAYKKYILYGEDASFQSVKNHFEGLHNIGVWLLRNYWIKDLVGKTVVDLLEGEDIGLLSSLQKYKEVGEFVQKYLKTGKSKHFRKIIRKLWELSTQFLERNENNLDKLQKDLNERIVLPPNDGII